MSSEWVSTFQTTPLFQHAVNLLKGMVGKRGLKADGVLIQTSPTGEVAAYHFTGELSMDAALNTIEMDDREAGAFFLLSAAFTYQADAIRDAYPPDLFGSLFYGTTMEFIGDVAEKLGIILPDPTEAPCGEQILIPLHN